MGMTIDQPDEEWNLYVFSARSAAVLGSSNVSTPKTPEPCQVLPAPNPAAPEDGRTPPNIYPNCIRRGVGSIPRIGFSQRVTECNSALRRGAKHVPEFLPLPQTRRGAWIKFRTAQVFGDAQGTSRGKLPIFVDQ
jgi:hypothetical protein